MNIITTKSNQNEYQKCENIGHPRYGETQHKLRKPRIFLNLWKCMIERK